jgi:hypothetical protein
MLDRLENLPRPVAVVLGIYAGAGMGTLAVPALDSLHQCAGMTSCAVSFLKGAVWLEIWPASWAVFLAGLK